MRAGRALFEERGCRDCHANAAFRDGANHDVGTITPSSGQRLGFALTEIRTPTLVELWDSAPYFHDGSAATLAEVFTIGAHAASDFSAEERASLTQFLLTLDRLYYINDEGVVNNDPVVDQALSDHQVPGNSAINIVIPTNTFSDPDGDPLYLTATQIDGSPLPT